MPQSHHVGATLLLFDKICENCSDVLILGRNQSGSLCLLTSYPEGDKAPLTQLVAEALVHLGRGGAGLYAGREWVMQAHLAKTEV